jgi:alpha-galactosidase
MCRTLPTMIDIALDMEELCPRALMLNYTNPMSMLCQGMFRNTDVEVVGLCHSVQAAHSELARVIGEEPGDCSTWTAGINHTAWVLQFSCRGEDAYESVRRAALEDEEWYGRNTTRVEMLRQLGYYVTESSGHNSEYNWWFRKREDLIEKYQREGFNGGTGYIKEVYSTDRDEYIGALRRAAEQDEFGLQRGHEYGSYIMNAIEDDEPFRFNGTVANTDLITNLPYGCSVEVPCYADKGGVHPCFVGDLPPQLAALNQAQVASLEMAVEAALTGDREMLFWSIVYDPLTAAALSMQEARDMFDELFEKEKHLMPAFAD